MSYVKFYAKFYLLFPGLSSGPHVSYFYQNKMLSFESSVIVILMFPTVIFISDILSDLLGRAKHYSSLPNAL